MKKAEKKKNTLDDSNETPGSSNKEQEKDLAKN